MKIVSLNNIEYRCVFVSDEDSRVTDSLKTLGIKYIPTVINSTLDKPISYHADCMCFNLNGTYFTDRNNYLNIVNHLTKGEEEKNNPNNSSIIRISEKISSPYPGDVRLNAKVFGTHILCNELYLSSDIKSFALSHRYNILHCNQGYAACSTVKLNDNAAITDDESVYNTLINAQIDCLKVSKGSVNLKGYDYGFIGGCCGMIKEKNLLFAGELETHSDSDIIIEFLNKYNINYLDLFSGELVDIGGVIELI